MLLYKLVQLLNSEDRREVKKLLFDSEYYEDLQYQSIEEFVLVKEQIQLGCYPKLDQKQ